MVAAAVTGNLMKQESARVDYSGTLESLQVVHYLVHLKRH
jgi:hypothetical protein